ncbi:hypothetical protein HELRODRAFT_193658, partial [Helobdella robusta]|uniref:Uncharacterized protein n=1 Tax=Helobdella robusta TaxID=6412 RepID=T1FV86_HELRO
MAANLNRPITHFQIQYRPPIGPWLPLVANVSKNSSQFIISNVTSFNESYFRFRMFSYALFGDDDDDDVDDDDDDEDEYVDNDYNNNNNNNSNNNNNDNDDNDDDDDDNDDDEINNVVEINRTKYLVSEQSNVFTLSMEK